MWYINIMTNLSMNEKYTLIGIFLFTICISVILNINENFVYNLGFFKYIENDIKLQEIFNEF